MSSSQLEFFLIGLAMLVMGAVLLRGRRSSLTRAYGRRVMRDDMAERWPALHGLVLAAMGSLLAVATLMSWLVGQDPRREAAAQASLAAAIEQSAGKGERLETAAAQAILHLGAPRSSIRAIAYTARRERPVCTGGPLPRCAPDNPAHPVASWAGELTWEERRQPDSDWYRRVCPADVDLTVAGAWEVNINENRCNPPSP